MPKVLVDETNNHEISATVKFDPTDLEQAFKKALVDSFSSANQQKLLQQGASCVCVDCQVHSDGTVTMTGLADDIHLRLYSPPMILPDHIKNDKVLEKQFWENVGNVIFDEGRLDAYRQRDNTTTNLQRSDAHQDLFNQVTAIKDAYNKSKGLNEFVTAVKENDVVVLHGGYQIKSQQQWRDDSILNGIEEHKDYETIKTKLDTLKAEAKEQQAQIQSSDNMFGP